MSVNLSQDGFNAFTCGCVLHLNFSRDYRVIRRAAGSVRTFLHRQGVPEADVWACELAFVEACNNSVHHAPVSQQMEEIQVEVDYSAERIEFRIEDHTAGFELPRVATLPPPDEESGRGLYLILSLMDDVGYVRRGANNCLILQKKVAGI